MSEYLFKVSALVCNDVARRDVRAKTITNQNTETTEKQDFKNFATINRLARMKTSPSLINARPYVQCHAHLKPSDDAIRERFETEVLRSFRLFGLKFSLSLLVIFGCVNTVLTNLSACDLNLLVEKDLPGCDSQSWRMVQRGTLGNCISSFGQQFLACTESIQTLRMGVLPS